MKKLNLSVFNTSVLGMLPVLLMIFMGLLPITATASYQFQRATTCKGVHQYSPYNPINETTSFSQNETVYAWMKLTNVHGYVKGKFVWVKPNGQIYATSTTHQVYSTGGSVVFYALQNFYNTHGQWSIKFMISHNNGSYATQSTKHCQYGDNLCPCPAFIDPVCGSDGNTYNNSCEAECAGVSYTSGACGSDGGNCICPAVVDPVCGSDGNTYNNACEATCAGVSYTSGPCISSCICAAIYDPVCGSDGNTYSNSCEAACAGITDYSKGACDVGSDCDLLSRISLNPDLCEQCLNEIAVYRYKGKNYLVSDSREASCADGMTIVQSCLQGTLCREGGIAGFTECSDINFFEQAQKLQVVLEDDCSSSATCACTKPAANNFCEDFQSYNPSQKLGPQSNCWSTWTGVEGGHQDGVIQRNNHTQNQYLKIKGNNPHGGGYQDVLLKLGNRTAGCFHLDFEIWLFSGHKGYYNIMHKHNISNPNNHQWASQVHFNGNGTGTLQVQGYHYPFHYGMGKWIKVSQHFDLDNDLTELYIDGRKVHRWRFSAQSANGHPGVNKLKAMSFYPRDQYHEFYIDDIHFTKAASLTNTVAESRNGETEEHSEINDDEAFAFVDETEVAMTVSPNPFQHAIDIQVPAGVQDGELSIFDQFGKLVRQLPTIKEEIAQTISLDVSDLAAGVYYVRLASKEMVLTEKIVKQ